MRGYDFATQVRIVRGRMPTLEMINERFARLFRISLFNMLRRSPEISVVPVQMSKFGEYAHTLHVPTSLNMVKFKPLRGTALFSHRSEAGVRPGRQLLRRQRPASPRSKAANSPPPRPASFTWC